MAKLNRGSRRIGKRIGSEGENNRDRSEIKTEAPHTAGPPEGKIQFA
jgi:hypothetical protein